MMRNKITMHDRPYRWSESVDFCLPYPYGDISESECGDRFTPNSNPQFVLSLFLLLMIHNNSKLYLSSFEIKEQPLKKRFLKLHPKDSEQTKKHRY
jgi:hypothetical protein